MGVKLTLEYWRENDWFVGKLREVPGVFSQGESPDELEQNIKDAYQMVMEDSRLDVPVDVRQKMVEVDL